MSVSWYFIECWLASFGGAVEQVMRKARKKVQGLPAGFRYHDLRALLSIGQVTPYSHQQS